MNDIISTISSDRMTSLQIAEVTGKLHKDVMKAIRNMEPAWLKVQGRKFALLQKQSEIHNGGYKVVPYYSLTKDECLYIATKFNDEARAKLIQRWMELEQEQAKATLPATYLDALKSLVKSEEQKQQLMLENKAQQQAIDNLSQANTELGNQITEMLPKVSYFDHILQSNATMTITQIAQDYGMSAVRLNKLLEQIKVQHKVQGQWILYGQYLSGGYVHSRKIDIMTADGRHKVRFNTEWTTKGQLFLYQLLKKQGIVPLIERPPEPQQQTIQFP